MNVVFAGREGGHHVFHPQHPQLDWGHPSVVSSACSTRLPHGPAALAGLTGQETHHLVRLAHSLQHASLSAFGSCIATGLVFSQNVGCSLNLAPLLGYPDTDTLPASQNIISPRSSWNVFPKLGRDQRVKKWTVSLQPLSSGSAMCIAWFIACS